MRKKLVLGLGRHAGTESNGVGASPGSQSFFRSLETSLRRHFSLVRVPPYYYSMDPRRSLGIARDVLCTVHACIFGLPPHPADLDAFFVIRDHMRRQIPFVYMPLGEFPRGAWFYRHIYKRLGRQDLILFSCRADLASYNALVSSTPARVAVVPWGIRASDFHRSAKTRATTRRQLGLEPDDVVLVYHGRVTIEKNVHGAIMMFRRLARTHPKTQLWIVGPLDGDHLVPPGPQNILKLPPTPLTKAFKQLLLEDGLTERVIFWGNVSAPSLPQVLGAADIGVNLTLNEDENFGFSTVEAMASGLAVVGSDWGGLKDTIEHGVTGFLVPTVVTSSGTSIDHWRAWKSALELVENVTLRKQMGAAAAERVAEKFTLERFARLVATEVKTQFADPAKISSAKHVWSPLGRRLATRYTTTLPGTAARTFPAPIPPTRTRYRDHPLIGKLVEPYATTVQDVTLRQGSIFFPATDLFDLRGGTLRMTDPRNLRTVNLIERADRAVIHLLKKRSFCDYQCLTRELRGGFDTKTIRQSLRRLLRAGIILQSTKEPVS